MLSVGGRGACRSPSGYDAAYLHAHSGKSTKSTASSAVSISSVCNALLMAVSTSSALSMPLRTAA